MYLLFSFVYTLPYFLLYALYKKQCPFMYFHLYISISLPCKNYVTILQNPLSPSYAFDTIALFKAATESKPQAAAPGKGEYCHAGD